MTSVSHDAPFIKLVQQLEPEGQLLRHWPLHGGVSAQVTAIELVDGAGQQRRLIIRQHGQRDRQRNPNLATAEFHLLQVLQQAQVAAPQPYYVDQAATIFATPALVIEYIDGTTEFAPADLPDFLTQAATQLAQIHQLKATQLEFVQLPLLGKGFGARPPILDSTLHEGQIRDRLEACWPLAQQNQATLLHGDFWPGNLLWRAGRLVAVIDWEDAALGDPLADLANSRLEVLWAFGEAAMQHFTAAYRTRNELDFTNLPYWDLCAALRPAGKLGAWGLAADTEATMRTRHQHFVHQACARLDQC